MVVLAETETPAILLRDLLRSMSVLLFVNKIQHYYKLGVSLDDGNTMYPFIRIAQDLVSIRSRSVLLLGKRHAARTELSNPKP